MEVRTEIEGRFWPSRVFYRWRWWVRIGVFGVPVLLGLATFWVLVFGVMHFQSRAVFSMTGNRSAQDAAMLLQTPEAIGPVVDQFDLAARYGVKKAAVIDRLSGMIKTRVRKGSRLIELTVSSADPEEARDFADALIKSFRDREKSSEVSRLNKHLMAARKFGRDLDDQAEERTKLLNVITKGVGTSTKIEDQEALENARADLLQTQKASADTQKQVQALTLEIADLEDPLTVASGPSLSLRPIESLKNPKLLRTLPVSLVGGWLLVLLMPFGLELLWPRRAR